jgi:hypothetical protein
MMNPITIGSRLEARAALIGTVPHIKSGCASKLARTRHIDKRMEISEDRGKDPI